MSRLGSKSKTVSCGRTVCGCVRVLVCVCVCAVLYRDGNRYYCLRSSGRYSLRISETLSREEVSKCRKKSNQVNKT